MDREAPKNKDDVRQAQEVQQAVAKAPPRPNEGAHRFLDQMGALQKWWAAPFGASSSGATPAATSPVPSAAAKTKPYEPLDLQDVPEAEQANSYTLDPVLQRKWFSNPAYAVQSREQKECLSGAPFYPPALVDSSTLKLIDLLKIERVRLAVDKIKSSEFLNSQPVQDGLRKVCSRLREGYGFDVDPQTEFKGDLQQMHRKYAFASITVGKRFLQGLDDIRVRDLDKSADNGDDVALALGEFKLYAAIQDAHVAYNGRTMRQVTIKEIGIYIMAPYGPTPWFPASTATLHLASGLIFAVCIGATLALSTGSRKSKIALGFTAVLGWLVWWFITALLTACSMGDCLSLANRMATCLIRF
jgi:hypothetical protein